MTVSTDLLERDGFLQTLTALFNEAVAGAGRTVLVDGEAGIGKTALIERFVREQSTRVLWGGCEALFTPRPLSPLIDIAHQLRGRVLELIESGAQRPSLFSAFLDALGDAPTIAIFEDIHWADEATLDLVKFLGRRIQRVHVLLILTCRTNEVTANHPLRLVLGDLPSGNVTRIELQSLSEDAVGLLARLAGRSVRNLFEITTGNPFFVTEVLGGGGERIPQTVRDAVLARAAHLSPVAQQVLDLASVVPSRVEISLVDAVLHPEPTALDECVVRGMLRQEQSVLVFRHELARHAVADALPPSRRRSLNAQILAALTAGAVTAVQLSRLVHHAQEADDRSAVQRFAPAAAEEASALGAHREAARHYATALQVAQDLSEEARAELLEACAYESWLTNLLDAAFEARREALAIRRRLHHVEKVGHNLRWLSRQEWNAGHMAEAHTYSAQAVKVLESLPPGTELAMAYSNQAQLHMSAENTEEALEWGRRAITLSERLGAMDILAHALNNVGSARFNAGDPGGHEDLERSLQLSLEGGYHEPAARAYANLVADHIAFRDFLRASRYLDEGILYCLAHDLDFPVALMSIARACLLFDQGQWDEASRLATEVAEGGQLTQVPHSRITYVILIGRLQIRRGGAHGQHLLDEGSMLATPIREMQTTVPVAAARAEAAWLAGDRDRCTREVKVGYELARTRRNPWALGEMAFWLWRGGGLERCPEGAAKPYALQIDGDWRAAAAEWERIGCPYERAMALMDGDETAQREALRIFEELGAKPAAEIVRRRLHEQGVRNLPRGPRASTRDNPAGLTDRELEVLALMAQGLANPQIAKKLFRSAKTVGHHVSAVLAKLGAASRMEAVTLARDRGILPTK
jgi:DNA-binding CsgD family transcriptional regulator/tetratricopeptide (TPR) repeat protein